jgi:hypothetical protein
MALNIKLQTYRGPKADLAALASTGFAGVLAYTTDTFEIFVDTGSGSGIPAAWAPLKTSHSVFTVANPAGLLSLPTAAIGDFAISTSNGLTYILTALPSTTSGNWSAITQSDVTGISATAHEWVTNIDAAGIQHLSQPAFTDISGLLAQTQLPATIGAGASLTNIDCGTF